jgi:hypothetical protein
MRIASVRKEPLVPSPTNESFGTLLIILAAFTPILLSSSYAGVVLESMNFHGTPELLSHTPPFKYLMAVGSLTPTQVAVFEVCMIVMLIVRFIHLTIRFTDNFEKLSNKENVSAIMKRVWKIDKILLLPIFLGLMLGLVFPSGDVGGHGNPRPMLAMFCLSAALFFIPELVYHLALRIGVAKATLNTK